METQQKGDENKKSEGQDEENGVENNKDGAWFFRKGNRGLDENKQ